MFYFKFASIKFEVETSHSSLLMETLRRKRPLGFNVGPKMHAIFVIFTFSGNKGCETHTKKPIEINVTTHNDKRKE